MTGFFTSPRVAWGPGAVEQLSGLEARRAFVVVDPNVVSRNGQHRVLEELSKSQTTVETVTAPVHADRLEEVEGVAAKARAFSPDWIVGVGGGRTLDLAKAVRLLVEAPTLTLSSLTPVFELPDPPRCRCVAIPTTSGSGSEASWAVDLRNSDDEPVELAHRSLTPDWALVDAGFAETLSNEQRRDGGAEALGQATEAYLSAWANPFSDALAVAVARTVFERLPHALKWSDDPEAKEALHYAATLSGLAASNAQRGVGHALARALMPVTGRSYGELVGILLPHVVEFDRPSARDRIEAMATALQRPDDRTAVPLGTRLLRLYDVIRLPSSLVAAGVDAAKVEENRRTIVANTLRSPGVLANPRVPAPADVELLLTAALTSPPAAP